REYQTSSVARERRDLCERGQPHRFGHLLPEYVGELRPQELRLIHQRLRLPDSLRFHNSVHTLSKTRLRAFPRAPHRPDCTTRCVVTGRRLAHSWRGPFSPFSACGPGTVAPCPQGWKRPIVHPETRWLCRNMG